MYNIIGVHILFSNQYTYRVVHTRAKIGSFGRREQLIRLTHTFFIKLTHFLINCTP